MDQGGILTFNFYYLSNTFPKPIGAIYSNFSDGSGQSKLKTWKGLTILDAINNMQDSWEEIKISTLTEVWKKSISAFMDDFEGFKTSADVAETAKKLELEVEPKLRLKCCNLMIKLQWV